MIQAVASQAGITLKNPMTNETISVRYVGKKLEAHSSTDRKTSSMAIKIQRAIKTIIKDSLSSRLAYSARFQKAANQINEALNGNADTWRKAEQRINSSVVS